MVEVSLLASFLGGVLSLLSPCSALLLPAFFAYAFGGRELIARTGLFYAGLCVTLVPLGMGIAAVSSLFYGRRSLVILLAGAALIVIGVAVLFGRGFTLGPLERLRGKVRGDSPGAVFALGAVYGLAGFCSGPILGAVLTVAAASGSALRGALLLAVYALGMAAPLFVLALLWDALDLGRRSWLRGREFSVGKLRFHTTSVISGLLFIILGATFIYSQGTSTLAWLYESDGAGGISQRAEGWIESVSTAVPEWVGIVALAVVASVVLVLWYLRPEKSEDESEF